MSEEKKIDFGSDALSYCAPFTLLDFGKFLISNRYSPLKFAEKDVYKSVPNDGKNNVVRINTFDKKIIFSYTSPDGKDQAKPLIYRLKLNIESKLKKIKW